MTKTLLVIDQFEQRLQTHRSDAGGELAAALRNCDGERVQAIVLIRDDFWMALTRFMAEIDVTIRQDRNCAAIDRFGKRHAREVLKLFGQAYGALPADDEKMTDDQKRFLDEAVQELEREEKDGRIAPVRLALFSQMLSEKEWSPPTLRNVGGAEGVGVAFLDETFETDGGRRRYQIGQGDLVPCRAILSSLLPDIGMDIKGGMRGENELLSASGCEAERDRFRRLLRILDSDTLVYHAYQF